MRLYNLPRGQVCAYIVGRYFLDGYFSKSSPNHVTCATYNKSVLLVI